MYLTDLLSLIVAVVFWCDMLGGILCWQDSLWWSGPTHNDPTSYWRVEEDLTNPQIQLAQKKCELLNKSVIKL